MKERDGALQINNNNANVKFAKERYTVQRFFSFSQISVVYTCLYISLLFIYFFAVKVVL